MTSVHSRPYAALDDAIYEVIQRGFNTKDSIYAQLAPVIRYFAKRANGVMRDHTDPRELLARRLIRIRKDGRIVWDDLTGWMATLSSAKQIDLPIDEHS